MPDHSQAIREAIVVALRQDADTLVIAGQRIYGRKVPSDTDWPLIRVEVTVTPHESTGGAGVDSSVAIHAFAKGDDETQCEALARAVVARLEQDELPLDDGIGLVSLDWQRTQILPEQKDGGFRALIQFGVTTEQ